jgi:hypothetical protein
MNIWGMLNQKKATDTNNFQEAMRKQVWWSLSSNNRQSKIPVKVNVCQLLISTK